MAISQAELPALFNALGDPTRLAVIAQLAHGPASVSELGVRHAMAAPSFLKHLRVLETAGLIRSEKTGRVRIVRLAPAAMRSAEDWVREHRLAWERRLDDLGAFLEQDTP